MKKDSYNILCEVIRTSIRKTSQLGLRPTPQGIRQATRVSKGLDPAHNRPGHKQAATKFLKKMPEEKVQSAGVIKKI